MLATLGVSGFLLGVLGGLHCVGMCGGISTAFALGGAKRPATVAVSFNIGRVATYVVAGAFAGAVSQSLVAISTAWQLRVALYLVTSAMLIVMGLHVTGMVKPLSLDTGVAQVVWRRLSRVTRVVMPADTPGRACALGAIWGWVPCGLSYSALLLAFSAADALSGAGVMLMFGLGTMPYMLASAWISSRLGGRLHRTGFRRLAGILLVCFGLIGLAQAANATAQSDWWWRVSGGQSRS